MPPQKPQSDPYAAYAGGADPYAEYAGTDAAPAAVPAAPEGNFFQQAIDRAAQTEPVTSFGSALSDLGAGAVRATLSPLAHPLDTLAGIGDIPLAPFSKTSRENLWNEGKGIVNAFREKPEAETLAALPTLALVGLGGEEAVPKRLSAAESAAEADRPWLRLASLVGPTGASQKALGVTPALAEDLREIIPQVGRTGARTPLGFAKAIKAFHENVAIPSYQTVSEPWAEEPLGGALQPPLSEFKMSTGRPLGSTPTIAQSERALHELNELTGPSYQAPANTFERQAIMANKEAASGLRSLLNQRLGELSGQEPELIGSLRERMGQTRNIAENAEQRALANSLGIDTAPTVAMKAGMARSMPARFLRATVAEPIENWQFRRALQAVSPAEESRLGKILKPVGALGPSKAQPVYAASASARQAKKEK